MRRLALVLVAVLALAACGSGHKKASGSPQAQIKSAYVQFFSGNTSISDRVALLQNGPKLEKLVSEFATNPLAKNVSATVASVTLQGANKAKVVYTVKLGGTALPTLTGTAVREDGTWKVGEAGLCRLVALGGTIPSVCRNRTF